MRPLVKILLELGGKLEFNMSQIRLQHLSTVLDVLTTVKPGQSVVEWRNPSLISVLAGGRRILTSMIGTWELALMTNAGDLQSTSLKSR